MLPAAVAAGVVLSRVAAAQNAAEGPPAVSGEPAAEALQEVVVTGTLIRGTTPPGAELVTLDRSAIEATGATTTTNLMTNLPQLSSFSSLPTGTTDFANPVPQFNIRASGGTLVLVNGHRLVGSGILQTTPDPSAIPVGAIERVEVLPDGASATYGADAVDGVVNFILRDHFQGAETRASYGGASHYHEYDLSQLLGTTWSSGSILGSFEYTSHSDFTFGSRSFYNNNLTAAGGSNHFVNNCSPPNIVVNGVSYAGPGFAPGQNLCDPNQFTDLVPYQRRASWFLAGHQSLTDNIEFRGDAFYSSNNQTSRVATSTSFFTLTNANPYFQAPPGTGATSETVDYWFGGQFGPNQRSEVDWTSLGVDLALQVRFGNDWQAKLSGNYGKGTNFARTPSVDGGALATAAASTTAAAAFDPFTGKTQQSVLNAISGGGVSYTSDQGLHDGEFDMDGPLFKLPGGTVRLAVGAEMRTESLAGVPYVLANGISQNIPNGAQSASRRDVAEYLELFVPIVGDDNAAPGLRKLVVSLAGRHDDYSDFGSTANPKFALDYKPIDSLTVHGSASTSFQAPSLADMRSVDTRLIPQAGAPFTPLGSLTTVPEIVIAGGTPTLQPQKARTYTVGFSFSPQGSGFNTGATYWHSDIRQQIGLAFPFAVPVFTNAAFSGFWWGPGGQPLTAAVLDSFLSQYRVDQSTAALTPAYRQALLNGGYMLDLRRKNLGETSLDGLDFHIDYAWQMGIGDMRASLAGVEPIHRRNVPGPGASEVDLSKNDPTQFRLGGEWSRKDWSGGINVNYVGPYNVTGTDVGTYQVATYITTDARITYHLDESAGVFLGKTDLTLKADNLFDRNPPFLLGANGFNSGPVGAPHANPIGRLVSVLLVKSW